VAAGLAPAGPAADESEAAIAVELASIARLLITVYRAMPNELATSSDIMTANLVEVSDVTRGNPGR
jgi:ABC-type antimicrobial peptide transport system permease subunit